ncbi:MAG: dihydrodipicolinate synthase family protein [Planctomycetales bacterium]|nr:dihydrodipicolinate synthase family protein [Planctomycetales bacterium]
MQTTPVLPSQLSESVIAVPPLARAVSGAIDQAENAKIIRYLERGGVSTLLYGGNALLYHVALSEYAGLLKTLVEAAASDTLVIPSVGPAYGMMMDQAEVLRDFDFPTSMILPQREVCTSAGLAIAVRRFVDRTGRPAVLYIKHSGFVEVEDVARMMEDGLLSWIKYAIVRENTSEDDYLRQLIDRVGGERVVSGIGEQPAIVHMRDFGAAGFTSGCVCIAPALSMQMLAAVRRADLGEAERIRSIFRPLENLRNEINPVRVLHAAVSLAGIAETGPISPLMSEVGAAEADRISAATQDLLQACSSP